MFLYIFCIKQGFLYRKNLLYLQCMKDFNIHKAKIRSLVASGYSVEQVANEFNVKYKDLKDFINKNRDVKRFWDSCENMREDVLLEQLAEHGKNKWNATVKMLEIMNPKQYSEVGIRLRAEKPDESTENEMLVNTINVRDSIIDKHYRHFESGHDWTLMEGGSRSGKTYNFLMWAYLQTRIRKFDLSIIAPSFKMLERGAFQDIKKILSDFDPEIHVPERPTKISLRNGSEWNFEVVTSENEAKRNRVNVFVNEADGIEENVANLLGRASGRKFADFNPVKRFWALNKVNETGSNILKTSWKDNPHLSANQLQWFADLKKNGENAEEGSPERYAYEVYYLGNYSMLSGKAYELSDFDIIDEDNLPSKFDYMLSYTDPSLGTGGDFFASLLFGIKGTTVYAVDCIFSQFAKTSGYVEQLNKWDEKYNYIIDHYIESNGVSGVVSGEAKQRYDRVLIEVNNGSNKAADIIVYSTTAKKFKFVSSLRMKQFIDQCCEFPNCEHDDAPDCLGRGAKIILKNFDIS